MFPLSTSSLVMAVACKRLIKINSNYSHFWGGLATLRYGFTLTRAAVVRGRAVMGAVVTFLE